MQDSPPTTPNIFRTVARLLTFRLTPRSSDLAAGLKVGHTTNEAGFGWRNATLLLLAEKLLER